MNARLKYPSKEMMNRARWAIAALALTSTFAITADAKITRTGTPAVTFHASGPAGMKIVGTTSDLDVDDQGAKIIVRVPLRNLTTGIALRDDHMRNKYLQVGSYPNAELTLDRSTLRFPNGDGAAAGNTTGSMAIHGKTKNVTVQYNLVRGSGTLHVGATMALNVGDYGIDIPSYLGVTVKPDIDVEVQFTATE